MKPLLSDKYNRKIFYIVSALLIFSLACFRIALDAILSHNALGKLLLDVLEGILTGAISSTAIALLILHLTPEADARAIVDSVPSHEKDRFFEQARINCDEWWFRGGTGRYTRSVTLPKLAEKARQTNCSKQIVIQLLDFRERVLLETYTSYRRGVRSAQKSTFEWQEEKVKHEICATIAAAFYWKAKEPLLDIEIYLTRAYSLFRVDFTNDVALVTKEDPNDPAMRFGRESFFYSAWKEDLRVTQKQAHCLISPIALNDLTNNSLAALFRSLAFSPELVSSADIAEILQLVQNPQNPYA